jgi:MarR family transcriptional regulator, organic hydroperoxide resistance regulator
MIEGNAISLIGRIHENANKFIIKELKANGIEGIVPSHGEILNILFSVESCTMTDLAEKIRRTKPTLTVLVDKLVDYGYVTREKDQKDARVTNIALTDKGRKLKPGFENISKNMNALVYNGLTDKESYELEYLLIGIESRFSDL